MSKKSAKIAALLEGVPAGGLDLHFAGYFACFNAGRYYEAHDVLEELWLPIRRAPDGDFYKGLIQLAGAFVHLQKGRLGPADALFALAEGNLRRFPDGHLGFEGASALRLIADWRQALAESDGNPLASRPPPRLMPPGRTGAPPPSAVENPRLTACLGSNAPVKSRP